MDGSGPRSSRDPKPGVCGGRFEVEFGVGFDVNDAIRGQQARHGGDGSRKGGRAEGRVEEDDVPVRPGILCVEPVPRVGVFDQRVVGAEQFAMPDQEVQGGVLTLEERGVGSAPGQGFETQHTAAGEQVENPCTGQVGIQPVEQRHPRPVGGRSHSMTGNLQLSPSPLTTDNADLAAAVLGIPARHERIVRKDNRKLDPVVEGGFAGNGSESGWTRLRDSLAKTRQRIAAGMGDLLLGERVIDEDLLDELETALLVADVGVDATQRVVESLKDRLSRRELGNAAELRAAMSRELVALLTPVARPFRLGDERPYVVLVVGVNGAGKTTLIGKLAKRLVSQGHEVLLAAGDTFRAAAVEQLSEWGERNGAAVVSQGAGADSASVIFDAIQAATARDVDVVLADTAGRLQAKVGLMHELAKIKRVMGRLGGAPHEVLLVLDAGVGQNALSQVAEFDKVVGVTSLAITKLDGTAKAGAIVAIAAATGLPVRFIGVGEGEDDLQDFAPGAFVDALLADLA